MCTLNELKQLKYDYDLLDENISHQQVKNNYSVLLHKQLQWVHIELQWWLRVNFVSDVIFCIRAA